MYAFYYLHNGVNIIQQTNCGQKKELSEETRYNKLCR